MDRVFTPSPQLAFGTKLSGSRKSASFGTMHVKNWWKTICTEEKWHRPTGKRWTNRWHTA